MKKIVQIIAYSLLVFVLSHSAWANVVPPEPEKCPAIDLIKATHFLMARKISDEAKKLLVAEIPLGRIGTPYDVWLALKFIIECDYFTGRFIEVDGGSTS